MPRSRAMRPAWSGPAPPKASSTKSRRSCPRMVEIALIASSIFTSMMRATPSAASTTPIPSGRATLLSTARYAAAGADGVDVHHRQREIAAFDLAAAGHERLAVLDQRDVAGRAAHVEGDDV